jgi:hypothetical protein
MLPKFLCVAEKLTSFFFPLCQHIILVNSPSWLQCSKEQKYADWSVKKKKKKISTGISVHSAVIIAVSSLHVVTFPRSWSQLAYCLACCQGLVTLRIGNACHMQVIAL